MRCRQRSAAACGPTRARGRAKRKQRAAGPRAASDQETCKERGPTGSQMAIWRRPSAPGLGVGDRGSVDGGQNAGRQRRPGKDRQRLGRQRRALTSMACVTVSTGFGGGKRCAIDLGAVAAWLGGWLDSHVVGEVVVATTVGRDQPHRGRRRITVPADMARVQTASEGEVNHRRDGRDDADKGTHGWPL